MGKILDLIPESLRPDLINEVKEFIQKEEKQRFNNGGEVSQSMKDYLKLKEKLSPGELQYLENMKNKK